MKLDIRPATADDAAAIARLTVQLGYDASAERIAERLSRILSRPDHAVFVADSDGATIGWIYVLTMDSVEADPFAVVGGLVVDAAQRGRGVGRALIQAAETWARHQTCAIVRLWSSTPRTGAHAFYTRLGYTNVKTQYSFAKALYEKPANFAQFVPRVE
jgi:GNAT superfamily N-acetyltransferase